MKTIDILNDYANGKIKDGFKFRCGNGNWVIEDDSIHSINQYMSHDGMGDYVYFEDCFDLSNLNDEVEIIEEKPEHIEKLEELKQSCTIANNYSKDNIQCIVNEFYRRISVLVNRNNELSKAVNYLLEKEK